MTGGSATGSDKDGNVLADAPLAEEELNAETRWERKRPEDSQDGIAALHDVEAEAGDEAEIADLFDMDHKEARQVGVELDSTGADEPLLD